MNKFLIGTEVSFDIDCGDFEEQIKTINGVIVESEDDHISIVAKTTDSLNGIWYYISKTDIPDYNVKITSPRKETDIDACRDVALMLLYAGSFEPIIDCTPICSHTFTNTTVVVLKGEDGKPAMADIYNDLDAREKWYDLIKGFIMEGDFGRIYALFNKPYRMLFVNLCKPHMAKWHFSQMLADVWVDSENPNQDINVKLRESIKNFKYADKEFLMTHSDYVKYQNIPNEITLYRGVSVGREQKGLSWTADRKTAEFFANRYGEGYVLEHTFKKEDIYCYLNTRGEDEYVCNTSFMNKRNK